MRMTAVGRLPPVASELADWLLVGVKQAVNAYGLLLSERLQRDKWRLSFNTKICPVNTVVDIYF